jgi:hypothetical protein
LFPKRPRHKQSSASNFLLFVIVVNTDAIGKLKIGVDGHWRIRRREDALRSTHRETRSYPGSELS